ITPTFRRSSAGRDTSIRRTSPTNGSRSISSHNAKPSWAGLPTMSVLREQRYARNPAHEVASRMNGRPQPALPAIEVAFPSLAPYAAGNTGIPYVWTCAAVVSGPHVLIQALTHGNEVCGAIALDRFLREGLRPTRGTVSLVFANVAAYQRFDPSDPFASRCI